MQRFKVTLPQLLVFYIAIYFSCIFLNFIPLLSILISGCISLILIYAYSNNERFGTRLFVGGFHYGAIFTIYALAVFFIFRADMRYYSYVDNIIKCLILFVFVVCLSIENSEFRQRVLKICFLGYIITTVITLINVIIDPEVLRKSSSQKIGSAIVFSPGGYDFIYGLIIFNIVLINMLKRGGKHRFILWLSLILNTVTVSISGYSIATILNLVFIILAFGLLGVNRLVILLAPLAAVIYGFLPTILMKLSKWEFLPLLTRQRLHGLANEGMVQYFINHNSRFDRAMRSMELIRERPLFGNLIGNPKAVYGLHTEWIDRIAQYGIIPFLFVAVFWVRLYKFQKKIIIMQGSNLNLLKLCYLYFIVLGFLNPCSYIFIVFPLMVFVTFSDELKI